MSGEQPNEREVVPHPEIDIYTDYKKAVFIGHFYHHGS